MAAVWRSYCGRIRQSACPNRDMHEYWDARYNVESLMASAYFNQVVTVQELIDIVAYLQPLYEVTPPQYDPYTYIDQ